MTQQEIEQRVEKARALFKQGFNCSQSVFAACADIYGIDDEALALRLSASFGGGIGRMRQTCGAACGMFMLAGLENGSATPHDAEGKMQNYALVQDLAAQFKAENGSLICSELLGIAPKPQEPTPEARTEAYYQKRPCAEMVTCAVRIFLTNLHSSTER
jgi:C_GCAxxG_C_C family probable redox protein